MISYAGVTLRMHTPEFAEVLNSVRFLEDAATYAPPYEVTASTIDGLPKYGPAPPPRLNTLWWPTGATRWCQGWFLAMQDELDEILSKVEGSSNRVKEFLRIEGHHIAEGIRERTELTTSMWMLPTMPVVPIAAIDYESELLNGCSILPLVDDRYWWQFASTPDDFEVTHDTTWEMMVSALETALTENVEQIIADDIPGAYLQPDAKTFNRQNYPAAVLLEAAAASLGRRVVRQLNGNYRLQSWQESDVQLADNLDTSLLLNYLGGGGYSRASIPSTVRVRFGCDHETKDKQASDVLSFGRGFNFQESDFTALAEWTKLVRTTALSGDQWSSEVDALAEQIASDYCNLMIHSYRVVYKGFYRWQATAYDDSVYWVLGCDQVTTTVQTCPPNLEVIDQYQQHPDGNIPDEGFADLTEDLEVDGTATAYLVEWDASEEEYAATTVEITLHSVNGRIGFDGLRVHFKRNPDNCQLELSCCNRQLFVVQADSTVTAGSTGTFSVYDYDDTDTGINITATSRFFAFGSGAQGWAELNAEGEWEATPGECS